MGGSEAGVGKPKKKSPAPAVQWGRAGNGVGDPLFLGLWRPHNEPYRLPHHLIHRIRSPSHYNPAPLPTYHTMRATIFCLLLSIDIITVALLIHQQKKSVSTLYIPCFWRHLETEMRDKRLKIIICENTLADLLEASSMTWYLKYEVN